MEEKSCNQIESQNKLNPNRTANEDREPKRKGKCYGQSLIIAVLLFISFQYYIYTYEIMWKTTTSKYTNLKQRRKRNIKFFFAFDFSFNVIYGNLVSISHNENKSWGNSAILGNINLLIYIIIGILHWR